MMVGIVIVSHSRRISEGVREMVLEMAPDAPLAATGGIDDAEHPLGTDALAIKEAIEEVGSADGVVVLYDIGSSKLNSEVALELLDEPLRSNVRLATAPLVEGALAAVMEATGGASAEQICAAAEATAQEMIAVAQPDDATDADTVDRPAGLDEPPLSEQAIVHDYQLRNKLGLHARPAAMLIRALRGLDVRLLVENLTSGSAAINGRSINQLIGLGAVGGCTIRITADGADAAGVHERIAPLFEEGFGEPLVFDTPSAPHPTGKTTDNQSAAVVGQPAAPTSLPASDTASPTTGEQLSGIVIREGVAIGQVQWRRRSDQHRAVPRRRVQSPDAEVERLLQSVEHVRARLSIAAEMPSGGDIYAVHLLMLDDPELVEQCAALIRRERVNTEFAWQQTLEKLLPLYRQIEDPILRARADDLQDVGLQVMTALQEQEQQPAEKEDQDDQPPQQTGRDNIYCYDMLIPSDLLQLDREHCSAICTVSGSTTSHAAILASALPIPVLVNLGPRLNTLANGAELMIDSDTLTVSPTDAQRLTLTRRQQQIAAMQAQYEHWRRVRVKTTDGTPIEVRSTIVNSTEAAGAADGGADGIGLFRSEFLFLNRTEPPSEEVQYAAYRQALEAFPRKPVVIRTMDIGGDKQVAYLEQGKEENPNLGHRGIRYSLAHPELFATQLRALLRAAADTPEADLRLLLPMITNREELEQSREQIDAACRTLGIATAPPIGIMVETPAALLILRQLQADFFSIGTNDLIQYIMAADRNNTAVTQLTDWRQPAVVRALQMIISTAIECGIEVGMCGRMASDPLATRLLLGLGLREFSVNLASIGAIKYRMGHLDRIDASRFADEIATLSSADDIRAACAEEFDQHNG